MNIFYQEQPKDLDPIQKWKLMIQDYDKGRKENPLTQKNERFSMKELHKKHREFDPIIGIYLNPKKESEEVHKAQESIKNVQQRKMMKGSIQYENDFDVFNRQSLKSKIFNNNSQQLLNENKINNMEHVLNSPNSQSTKGQLKKLILPEARDYNIITNGELDPEMLKGFTFLKNQKSLELQNFVQQTQKAKQNKSYNPITQKIQYLEQTPKQPKSNTKIVEKKQVQNDYQLQNTNIFKPENIREYIPNVKQTQQINSKNQNDNNMLLYSSRSQGDQKQNSYFPEILQSPKAYDFNQHDNYISCLNRESSSYNPLFNPQRFEFAKQQSERSFYQNYTEITPRQNNLGINKTQNEEVMKSLHVKNSSFDQQSALPKIKLANNLSIDYNQLQENQVQKVEGKGQKFNPKIHRIKTGGFSNKGEDKLFQ